MGFWSKLTGRQQRATYTRSDGDLLLNSPQGMWLGVDSGGGAYPIGPNGPHPVKVLPAVTRLCAIITDPLSVVPWTVVTSTVGMPVGGQAHTPPRWITDPQLLRPDARFPFPSLPAAARSARSTFWAGWIRSAVMHGTGFLLFAEDADGAPLAGTLRLLNPMMVTSVRDDDGVLVWEFDRGVRTDRDGRMTFGTVTWRIVALRDPHAPMDGEGRSIGVFERHADTFGLSGALETYARGVFRSGIPAGYLKVNAPGLTKEKADDLKAKWLAAHGGDERSIAVLNATTDFTPLTFSPVDAALIESKRANLADLALAFALDPAGALGISMGNSATYKNVKENFQRLRQDLLPWITAVEQTIGSLLPAGRDLRLDFAELTRPEPEQQYAALKVAIDAKILDPDEARAIIGLPPRAVPRPRPQLVPPVTDETEEVAQ